MLFVVFKCTLAKNSWNFFLAFLFAEATVLWFGWWWDLVRVSEQMIIFLNLIFTSCSWFMVTHISDLKLSLFSIVFFKYGPSMNSFYESLKPQAGHFSKSCAHVLHLAKRFVPCFWIFFQSDFSVAFLCVRLDFAIIFIWFLWRREFVRCFSLLTSNDTPCF